MAKPVYNAIVRLAGQLQPKPAIVFVPTRKQVTHKIFALLSMTCTFQSRLTAIDLLAFAAADSLPNRFLHLPAEDADLQKALSKVSDATLRECLSSGARTASCLIERESALLTGVAYLHEGVSEADSKIVSSLFESGAVQVCMLLE